MNTTPTAPTLVRPAVSFPALALDALRPRTRRRVLDRALNDATETADRLDWSLEPIKDEARERLDAAGLFDLEVVPSVDQYGNGRAEVRPVGRRRSSVFVGASFSVLLTVSPLALARALDELGTAWPEGLDEVPEDGVDLFLSFSNLGEFVGSTDEAGDEIDEKTANALGRLVGTVLVPIVEKAAEDAGASWSWLTSDEGAADDLASRGVRFCPNGDEVGDEFSDLDPSGCSCSPEEIAEALAEAVAA